MTERKILKLNSILSDETKKKLMAKFKIKKSEAQRKKEKKDKIFNAVKWLVTTFPNCFSLKHKVPFKLQIEKDIFNHLDAGAPSRIAIRQALKWYVHGQYYLNQLLTCTHRIDLNGNIIDDQPISQSDKDYASKSISYLESIKKSDHRLKSEQAVKLDHKTKQDSPKI